MSAERELHITATEIRNGLYNLYSLELAKHLHSCGMITHTQFLEAASDSPNRIGSNALRFAKENSVWEDFKCPEEE